MSGAIDSRVKRMRRYASVQVHVAPVFFFSPATFLPRDSAAPGAGSLASASLA